MSYTDHIFTAYRQRCAALAESSNKLAAGVAYVEGAYVPVDRVLHARIAAGEVRL